MPQPASSAKQALVRPKCRSPRRQPNRLQCVLNPAARIVSQTRKFDGGLTHLLHTELHWLDVPERVQYKRGVTVHQCMQHKAPQYLVDCCTPSSNIASHQRLRSASRRTATLTEQVWSSGLLHRRPRCLELSTSWLPWPVAEFWLL